MARQLWEYQRHRVNWCRSAPPPRQRAAQAQPLLAAVGTRSPWLRWLPTRRPSRRGRTCAQCGMILHVNTSDSSRRALVSTAAGRLKYSLRNPPMQLEKLRRHHRLGGSRRRQRRACQQRVVDDRSGLRGDVRNRPSDVCTTRLPVHGIRRSAHHAAVTALQHQSTQWRRLPPSVRLPSSSPMMTSAISPTHIVVSHADRRLRPAIPARHAASSNSASVVPSGR